MEGLGTEAMSRPSQSDVKMVEQTRKGADTEGEKHKGEYKGWKVSLRVLSTSLLLATNLIFIYFKTLLQTHQGSVPPELDHRDQDWHWDWRCLSLNDETKTENVWVLMTRPRQRRDWAKDVDTETPSRLSLISTPNQLVGGMI